jgi:hypothetical protein
MYMGQAWRAGYAGPKLFISIKLIVIASGMDHTTIAVIAVGMFS